MLSYTEAVVENVLVSNVKSGYILSITIYKVLFNFSIHFSIKISSNKRNMMFYWKTPRQSYSDPIVMLTSPGWMKVEWYHWFVSTTTEKE